MHPPAATTKPATIAEHHTGAALKTTTIGALPATILAILLILMVYHWIESGEGISTGAKMTVQDVKVGVSCRQIETAARFIGRRYEDYLEDRRFFKLPGWKHLVCPLYGQEATRTPEYRDRAVKSAWENRMTKMQRNRIAEYAKLHNTTVFKLLYIKQ